MDNPATEADLATLKELLDNRYAEIATLLRYNKTKDESIKRLGDEIQKYREGFAFSALKPFINALIALREDCRKSIKDAKQYPEKFNDENVKKYTGYLVSDFEDMLSNVGLERNLTPPPAPTPAEAAEPSAEEASEPLKVRTEPLNSFSELVEYLKETEKTIEIAVKDRAIVDKTIQDYIGSAARTDAVHYYALVAPISKQIYGLFDYISQKASQTENVSGEALLQLYTKILEKIMEEISDILTITAGMEIETLDGVFDAKKHKILKTVLTDDEKLDKTVANIYTDCYTYEEKVIYQSKVDVYKLNLVSTQGGKTNG